MGPQGLVISQTAQDRVRGHRRLQLALGGQLQPVVLEELIGASSTRYQRAFK